MGSIQEISLTLSSCVIHGGMAKKYAGSPANVSREDLIICGDRCMKKGFAELAGFAYAKAKKMPLVKAKKTRKVREPVVPSPTREILQSVLKYGT